MPCTMSALRPAGLGAGCGLRALRSASSAIVSPTRAALFPPRRAFRVAASAATPAVPAGTTSSNGGPPAPAPAPPPAPPLVPPPVAYERAVGMGVAKANLPCMKILAMGVMAGIMIGYGAFMAAAIGGNCAGMAAAGNPGLQKMIMGAFGLPFGLLMVLVCGAELFTGNTALVTAAYYEGKVTPLQLAKSWSVSFVGNFIGSMLMVFAIHQAGMLAIGSSPAGIAVAKTSLTWTQAFIRGILCNFLVCIGIWQATAANSLPGKAVGVWFPISAFVALGFEHSVANMFLIPMGIMCGADVTFSQFITSNLIPVTLGNTVGGAFFVATAYSYIFGKLGKKEEA